jgi:hypothetical protein
VLWGKDLFAGLAPSREAMLTRLRQILLNFTLRTRERYALVSLRPEQLVSAVADARDRCARPRRSSSSSKAIRPPRPKEALEKAAAEIDATKFTEALAEPFAGTRGGIARARSGAAAPSLARSSSSRRPWASARGGSDVPLQPCPGPQLLGFFVGAWIGQPSPRATGLLVRGARAAAGGRP